MPLICARRSGQPAARIVGIHYRYRADPDEQSTTLVLEDQYVADRESVKRTRSRAAMDDVSRAV